MLDFAALKEEAAKIPARAHALVVPGLDVEHDDGIGSGRGDSGVGAVQLKILGILTPLDVSVIQGMRRGQINSEIIVIGKLNSHCYHLTPVLK